MKLLRDIMEKNVKNEAIAKKNNFWNLENWQRNTFASRLSPMNCKTMFKLICKAIKTEKQTLGKNEIESFEQ